MLLYKRASIRHRHRFYLSFFMTNCSYYFRYHSQSICHSIVSLSTIYYNSFIFIEHLFNLRFAAKELQRNAKKCEKDEKTEKNKLKLAIQKGNTENARIHAENAIRKKNESLNYMRMYVFDNCQISDHLL